MESPNRYLALDVFRGMTIALMILVNTPGSWQFVYSPLRHASWHGSTPTDLVFPFFLFAVGVSLSFSWARSGDALNRGPLWRVARRVLVIFALGLFVNSFPQWQTFDSPLRVMGVLQRIALAYGLAACLVLILKRRWLWVCGTGILLAYWGLLCLWGGPDPYALDGNAVLLVDRLILGEAHLYRGFGIPFDPEGLLSTLPACVTVLIGYLAGETLRDQRTTRTVIWLTGCGLLLACAGYLWGFVWPINKPLWTGSYVLYTGGLALLVFAAFIFLVDLKGYKKWTPVFSIFGMNPLFLFVLSALWARTLNRLILIPDGQGGTLSANTWLFEQLFVPLAGPMNGSLLFAVAHVAGFWLIGYGLYRMRWFIKA